VYSHSPLETVNPRSRERCPIKLVLLIQAKPVLLSVKEVERCDTGSSAGKIRTKKWDRLTMKEELNQDRTQRGEESRDRCKGSEREKCRSREEPIEEKDQSLKKSDKGVEGEDSDRRQVGREDSLVEVEALGVRLQEKGSSSELPKVEPDSRRDRSDESVVKRRLVVYHSRRRRAKLAREHRSIDRSEFRKVGLEFAKEETTCSLNYRESSSFSILRYG